MIQERTLFEREFYFSYATYEAAYKASLDPDVHIMNSLNHENSPAAEALKKRGHVKRLTWLPPPTHPPPPFSIPE